MDRRLSDKELLNDAAAAASSSTKNKMRLNAAALSSTKKKIGLTATAVTAALDAFAVFTAYAFAAFAAYACAYACAYAYAFAFAVAAFATYAFATCQTASSSSKNKMRLNATARLMEKKIVCTKEEIMSSLSFPAKNFGLTSRSRRPMIDESSRVMEKTIVWRKEEIISSLTSFSNAYVASYVPPISLIQDQDQNHTQTDDLSLGCLIAGHLSFGNSDRDVNYANLRTVLMGICVDKIVAMKNEGALFILLVGNKDAFKKLAECEPRFIDAFPCIIVSAEEQPSDGTRRFLRMMKRDLKLPVLALVDSDPVGMKILSAYASLDLDIKWLGVRPSDLDRYNVPMNCRLKMTARDVATGIELLQDEIVKKNWGWLYEGSLMMQMRKKVEVQAFGTFGLEYLLEVYLPLKLQEMDWI